MQKITLIGNLGKDPEERFTSTNKRMITFSVAVRISKDVSVWYDCNIWEDKIAQFKGILEYLKKGSKVCIIADLGLPKSYQDK
jgi:single-strand DNA-binding protein